jgi:hypothetical protein
MTTNTLENEKKILIEMFQFAKEFSYSEIPKLYELGHYLTDNLLSKVCMVVGNENGIAFEYTTRTGNIRTHDLKWLYNNILEVVYHQQQLPDYDNEIKDLHEQRNNYQHGYLSIISHFNKQYAIDYNNKVEKVFDQIGFFRKPSDKKLTNYLKSNLSFSITKKSSEPYYAKGFRTLYRRLAKKDSTNIGIELLNIIQHEIGITKFNSVMAFKKNDYFYNDLWTLTIFQFISGFSAGLKDMVNPNQKSYNFYKPNDNVHVLDNFLKYMKEQCQKNDISLD